MESDPKEDGVLEALGRIEIRQTLIEHRTLAILRWILWLFVLLSVGLIFRLTG